MQLIPPIFESNNSKLQAEKMVFEKLIAAFPKRNDFVAFHSLNLTTHKYKRESEADFVILCPFGVYILEIKGGGIKFVNGQWSTTDRYGVEHKIHSPFEQASGAMHALRASILNSNTFSAIKKIPFGYGVVFPNVDWMGISSVEWDRSIISDSHNLKNFEKWLEGLFKYWKEKPNNHGSLNGDEIKKLKQLFRPNFDKVPSLYSRIEGLENRLIELSFQQYAFIDFIEANQRILCYGGAGTGKTLLASETARRRSQKFSEVALICKSEFLASYLKSIITEPNITISALSRMQLTMREKNIEKFDSIILDEAQDLFNMDDLIELDEVLVNGLQNGNWTFFHDVNNQSGLFSKVDDDAIKLIKEDCSPLNFPLNINFRNTKQIIRYVQHNLQVDIGNTGIGDGPSVEEHYPSSQKETVSLLIKIFDYFKQEHISPGDITVLSPLEFWESSLIDLPNQYQSQIVELDSYSIKNFPLSKISFSTIKNFKGIENKIIVLIDTPKQNKPDDNLVQQYVGLTRARDYLTIIWS